MSAIPIFRVVPDGDKFSVVCRSGEPIDKGIVKASGVKLPHSKITQAEAAAACTAFTSWYHGQGPSAK